MNAVFEIFVLQIQLLLGYIMAADAAEAATRTFPNFSEASRQSLSYASWVCLTRFVSPSRVFVVLVTRDRSRLSPNHVSCTKFSLVF